MPTVYCNCNKIMDAFALISNDEINSMSATCHHCKVTIIIDFSNDIDVPTRAEGSA